MKRNRETLVLKNRTLSRKKKKKKKGVYQMGLINIHWVRGCVAPVRGDLVVSVIYDAIPI
jgi:hypothetical protein